MIDKQFYPTPSSLAYKAYDKFKNKGFTRLLEPSAGRGDLLSPWLTGIYTRTDKIDCIEIDFSNQAVLRAKKLNVIDADFMQSDLHGMYDKIIMNPPFSQGAEHVIKAFNLLINGELVAIVNAETVRNPHTAQRKYLVGLIEQYGTVEFIRDAFIDPDTQRKTPVEIALIWLERKSDIKQTFTQNLEVDNPGGLAHETKRELAIKGSVISNAVAVFKAAVASLKASEIAREEANYYAELLGKPMNQMATDTDIKPERLQERFNDGYDALKNRAWNNVLGYTEFQKYLSSKAYQNLVADFEQVSKLSFTESNIRGFLLGLVEGQGEMNMQMLLDTFDRITLYRPENRAYYRGWKSNAKHATQAWQIKMTRFVLPMKNHYSSNYMDHRCVDELRDFDKTFAMLDGKAWKESELIDGKQMPTNSLYNLFQKNYAALKDGARVSTDYFDVRHYAGIGTVHFYPRDKKLIDRFNRLVGKERAWLPKDDEVVNPVFWDQYEKAESVTKAMVIPKSRYGRADEYGLPAAHLAACEKLNIDVAAMLALDAA